MIVTLNCWVYSLLSSGIGQCKRCGGCGNIDTPVSESCNRRGHCRIFNDGYGGSCLWRDETEIQMIINSL